MLYENWNNLSKVATMVKHGIYFPSEKHSPVVNWAVGVGSWARNDIWKFMYSIPTVFSQETIHEIVEFVSGVW